MRLALCLSFSCGLCFPCLAQTWGGIDYKGEPWVSNADQPYRVSRGLEGRHIALWASHGRYYDAEKGGWQWQRPTFFCTNEDLYTQTIVVPYLIPMLENAGAVVFTPRERDWQRNEVIVDNDDHTQIVNYIESGFKYPWENTDKPGFAFHRGHYYDGENPFVAGTARQAKATTSKSKYSQVSYQPNLPEEGSYAVYVSYQTQEKSVDDAHYTVWHKGQKTEFRVNQRIGGSTWVYIGTFDFDKGCSQFNRVTLTNQSSHRGVVTADAVRFGGGMGNIERGGEVSGLPRCLEGARYGAQWMGIPSYVYVHKDDYRDDINIRSQALNYVAGGSCYYPDTIGLGVPLELSLAVHSDAGYAFDGRSVYGALSIHTTDKDSSTVFRSGLSRTVSGRLATALLDNETADLKATYGTWTKRKTMDRNYSETRLPEVPSAILETMSHQSFPDMRYGQDPNFRFTLARSIYKTILRFVSGMHNEHCDVAPLAPNQLAVEIDSRKGEARLSWQPVEDPLEPSAEPTGYVVYTATGHTGFDNGTTVRHPHYSVKLEPGVLYSFRVSAINKGGRSFPSEVVSAYFQSKTAKTVLIVNGFHRLSSPEVIDNDTLCGFDIYADLGVSYGRTAGWAGRQIVFDRRQMGLEDETGLGYGTMELAGMFLAGNDFNYIRTHAEAIAADGRYNIVSCSGELMDNGVTAHGNYDMVDLILGLERNDGHSLLPYKTFTPAMQQFLRQYTKQGGALLVSGANVCSDMMGWSEQQFIGEVLKSHYAGKDSVADETIWEGLDYRFTKADDTVWKNASKLDFHRFLNERHYAAPWPDRLQCDYNAKPLMTYADGYCAAVGYQGRDYRSLTMGFPFECIKDERQRTTLMGKILNYLINNN